MGDGQQRLCRENVEGVDGVDRFTCVLGIGESTVIVDSEDGMFAGTVGGEESTCPWIVGGKEGTSGAVEDDIDLRDSVGCCGEYGPIQCVNKN